jgi:hypothetical protein
MSTKTSPSYEDEVFKFFTQPENFETMLRVNEHADSVFKGIIQDFWDALRKQISEELKDSSWQIDQADILSSSESKLRIYQKSWCLSDNNTAPTIAVAFGGLEASESLFVGITIDENSITHSAEELKREIRKLDEVKEFISNDFLGWACWKYLESKAMPKDLMSLLPENRSELVKDYAKIAIDLAVALEKRAEEILPKPTSPKV